MPDPQTIGQTALKGWRAKLADAVAPPTARRLPLSEGQVRAVIGAALFASSVVYVVSTARDVARQARG